MIWKQKFVVKFVFQKVLNDIVFFDVNRNINWFVFLEMFFVQSYFIVVKYVDFCFI